eukprot:2171975-Prymnesium_polylepis.1
MRPGAVDGDRGRILAQSSHHRFEAANQKLIVHDDAGLVVRGRIEDEHQGELVDLGAGVREYVLAARPALASVDLGQDGPRREG